MTNAMRFWDNTAERYAARKIGDEDAYAATLERIRHWLSPQMHVLEIGCGTGTTALQLADAASSIVATDGSAEMIRIARSKAEGSETVRFVQAEVMEAGGGLQYDAVLGFNILHLVDDLPATLAYLRGLLPKGGLLICKTPCLGGKRWLRPVVWGLQRVGKAPPAISFLTPEALQAAIRGAGFAIVETGDYPQSVPSHFVVGMAL